jgi:hypothetical protein
MRKQASKQTNKQTNKNKQIKVSGKGVDKIYKQKNK